MFKWAGTVTDTSGNSLEGWQIECVQDDDGETVVPIYSDKNSTPIVSISGVANRAVADALGNYFFFVDSGTYSLRFYDATGEFQRLEQSFTMYGDVDNQTAQNVADAQAQVALAADQVALAADQVTLAEGFANQASASATAAETAKTDAETAVAAAAATGNIFADIAAGLAGTANGEYFFVENANDDLQLYLNNAGTEVAQDYIMPGRAAIDAAIASAAIERANNLTDAVKAAGGDKVKLLVTPDGAKTFRSGTTDEIETLEPLIGGTTLVQPATTYSGAANPILRPQLVGDAIRFHHQTGFNLSQALLSGAANYSIDMIFDLPTIAATFADVASMDAAAGTYPNRGTIVEVTGTPYTTLAEDIADKDQWHFMNLEDANLTAGLYIRSNAGWSKLAVNTATMMAFTNTGNVNTNYLRFLLDMRGEFRAVGFDGSVSYGVRCPYSLYDETANRFHVKVLQVDGYATLFINGEEVPLKHNAIDLVTDILYFNGRTRSGSAAAPISGGSWDLVALSVAEGVDFTESRMLSNVIAEHYGTPTQKWSPEVFGLFGTGQSNEQPDTSVPLGPNTPDATTGWRGELTRDTQFSPLEYRRTLQHVPDLFCTKSEIEPNEVGNWNVFTAANGSFTDEYLGGGGSREGTEVGFATQVRNFMPDPNEQIWFYVKGRGGYSLPLVQQKSTPPKFVRALKDGTSPTSVPARESDNRALAEAVDFFKSRGQRLIIRVLYNGQVETSTGVTASEWGAAHKSDFLDWIPEIKAITGQSETPVCVKKLSNYQHDGQGNLQMIAANEYRDDQIFRLYEEQAEDFPFILLESGPEIRGPHIHRPIPAHRKTGEVLGRAVGRALYGDWDWKPTRITSADWTIAPNQVRLFFSEPMDVVENYLLNIGPFITDGTYTTYGIVVEGITTAGLAHGANVALAPDGTYADVTFDQNHAVGDAITITGAGVWNNNFRAKNRIYGELFDQDWTLTLDGDGRIPMAEGAVLNELTPWLPPQRVERTV